MTPKGGDNTNKYMKKLIAYASAAAMFLSAAAPAGAMFGDTTNNFAFVNSKVKAEANTGDNYQSNFSFFGGGKNFVMTGVAISEAEAVVVTNTNVGNDCGCFFGSTTNNTAFVNSKVVSEANTGDNVQTNLGGGWNTAFTGNAGAGATGWVVTNTNWH